MFARKVLALAALSLPGAALAAPVCHIDGNGTVKQLDVGSPAVAAHLKHGDFLPTVTYRDRDGDGHGDASLAVVRCGTASGYVAIGDDLDDTNPAVGACLDVTGTWWTTLVVGDVSSDIGPAELTGTTCAFTSRDLVATGTGSSFTVTSPAGTCQGVVMSTNDLEITCGDQIFLLAR